MVSCTAIRVGLLPEKLCFVGRELCAVDPWRVGRRSGLNLLSKRLAARVCGYEKLARAFLARMGFAEQVGEGPDKKAEAEGDDQSQSIEGEAVDGDDHAKILCPDFMGSAAKAAQGRCKGFVNARGWLRGLPRRIPEKIENFLRHQVLGRTMIAVPY
jgi:hypothetical protein